jgi:GxxExxY protein
MKIVIDKLPVEPVLRQQLVDYVYPIVGCMHYIQEDLGPGLPEYIYQEALFKKLKKEGFDAVKEFIYHPFFDGEPLEAFVKMDLLVKMPRGNVIIECKSIAKLTDREQFQTFGYLRATQFPIAILVNFGAWPKSQIERYYFHEGVIKAF